MLPSGNTTFTIFGTDFSDNVLDTKVAIGGQDCLVSMTSNTSITCQVGPLPAGPNSIDVYVANKGRASSFVFVTSEKIAKIVSPEESSIYGGATLVIEGNGFETSDTQVDVAGQECKLSHVTHSKVTLDCLNLK